MRIVVLDDYQGVAASYAAWNELKAEVVFVSQPITDDDELVTLLSGTARAYSFHGSPFEWAWPVSGLVVLLRLAGRLLRRSAVSPRLLGLVEQVRCPPAAHPRPTSATRQKMSGSGDQSGDRQKIP